VFLIHAHLVFVTKYRRGVLTGEHLDYLRSVFADVCQDFGATLAEMDGEDDHVHIFSPDLGRVPTDGAALQTGELIEGCLLWELGAKYKVRTHRDHLWSPSYFAASCAGAAGDIIGKYVENQRTRTWRGMQQARKPGPEGPGLRSPKHGQPLCREVCLAEWKVSLSPCLLLGRGQDHEVDDPEGVEAL